MNEATYALIGVAVGAVIPAVTSLYSTRVEGERAGDDRQEARDARLFDHRRDAYTAFTKEARRILDWLWHVETGFHNTPDPDYDSYDSLLAREADVLMYGSVATSSQARAVVEALAKYSGNKNGDGSYEVAEKSIRQFTEAARSDLGVTN